MHQMEDYVFSYFNISPFQSFNNILREMLQFYLIKNIFTCKWLYIVKGRLLMWTPPISVNRLQWRKMCSSIAIEFGQFGQSNCSYGILPYLPLLDWIGRSPLFNAYVYMVSVDMFLMRKKISEFKLYNSRQKTARSTILRLFTLALISFYCT